MKRPILYNLTPAKGQALLNFQGRIFPKSIELYETELKEEIRNKNKSTIKVDKEKQLHDEFRNLLIQGDCLSACAYLKSLDIKIDLVYIDPPFASGAIYAKKIYLRNGKKMTLENEDTSLGEEVMYSDIWQKEDYLNWLYERLLAIRDVIVEKGSIYVHLDWHIGHYAKILLDEVFGQENFVNEIAYCYTGPTNQKHNYPRKHDVIFLYSKSDDYIFNSSEARIPFKKSSKSGGKTALTGRASDEELEELDKRGKIVEDWWVDIPDLGKVHDEDEGYVTQKSEKLLERIISVSSDEGMIIADFFSGSGTTPKVANQLGRKFIACDVGVNAIQTTRDRLVKNFAEFDLLKVNDGIKLFRNPAQTTAKIFRNITGFKSRGDLGIGDFWDGGIVNKNGVYVPIKIIPIFERLTKELLDVIFEEVYKLQDVSGAVNQVRIVYAHKEIDVDQSYIEKRLQETGKTTIRLEIISLDELLCEKAEKLFLPDNADILITDSSNCCQVEIVSFFSPYLKTKIDEFNLKKTQRKQQLLPNAHFPATSPIKVITISEKGLELIESVQFDTTLNPKGIWTSNPELEDKAGIKEKIKGKYNLLQHRFKIKIRNIAGDEIILDSDEIREKTK